jgi:hypothetical protein
VGIIFFLLDFYDENRLALAFVTLAIAAIVTGMTTVSTVQVAQAQPEGRPYGELVSDEARTGGDYPGETDADKGFGDDIKFCRTTQCAGFEQSDGNNGIGDARASDEAGKSPGKAGVNRDETAGNPNN